MEDFLTWTDEILFALGSKYRIQNISDSKYRVKNIGFAQRELFGMDKENVSALPSGNQLIRFLFVLPLSQPNSCKSDIFGHFQPKIFSENP